VLKELGNDSEGVAVSVCTGRYGPYIKHGKKNVGLPKEFKDPSTAEKLSLEKALEIIGKKK
jgi:DNA topoisomerase-1